MPVTLSGFAQKALLGSAFCFLALAFASAWAQGSQCTSDAHDLIAEVREVIDGDSVLLTDGRQVRFIGVNTPERAKEGRVAEPLADAARAALIGYLASGDDRIALDFDSELQDRYGRLLAHVFLPDGASLSARLIRDGWGLAIAVPPNLALQECYRLAEQEARTRRRGVWADAYYGARDAGALETRTTGFMRVKGRLDRIGFSRSALWLQIGRLGVRIDKRYLPYFRHWNFHALQGLELEVRGWVSGQGGRLRMNLKHPNDLEVLTASQARE